MRKHERFDYEQYVYTLISYWYLLLYFSLYTRSKDEECMYC